MARTLGKFQPKTNFQRNLYDVVEKLASLHGDHTFVVLGFARDMNDDAVEVRAVEHGIATNLHDHNTLSKYLRLVSEQIALGNLGEHTFTLSKKDFSMPPPKGGIN